MGRQLRFCATAPLSASQVRSLGTVDQQRCGQAQKPAHANGPTSFFSCQNIYCMGWLQVSSSLHADMVDLQSKLLACFWEGWSLGFLPEHPGGLLRKNCWPWHTLMVAPTSQGAPMQRRHLEHCLYVYVSTCSTGIAAAHMATMPTWETVKR